MATNKNFEIKNGLTIAGTERISSAGVFGGSLADDSVTTAAIADDAVTSAKIPDNAITSAKIADDAVTSAKIPDNAITSAKIAANAVTSTKLLEGSSGPLIKSISGILIPSVSGNITITGAGFSASNVYVDTGVTTALTAATSVTNTSSTSLTATLPALSAGQYKVFVVNSDGQSAIFPTGVLCSLNPTWSTSAGALEGALAGNSYSVTVAASSDSTIAYSVASGALPSGITLNSSTGVISGTAPSDSTSTTYNFTLRATDAESQTADRAFSIFNLAVTKIFTFTGGSLPSGITHSRTESSSTVASYINSSGYVAFASAGTPRFTHKWNGSSAVAQGILVEERRGNMMWSSDVPLSSDWNGGGAAITFSNETVTLPTGSSGTARKAVIDAGTNTFRYDYHTKFAGDTGTAANADWYTWSGYVKRTGGDASVRVRNYDNTQYYMGSTFNLTTKAVVSNYAGNASLEELPNGWFRWSVSGYGPVGPGVYITIEHGQEADSAQSPGNYTATTLYHWGMQFERGRGATSYITNNSSYASGMTNIIYRESDYLRVAGTDWSNVITADSGTTYSAVLAGRVNSRETGAHLLNFSYSGGYNGVIISTNSANSPSDTPYIQGFSTEGLNVNVANFTANADFKVGFIQLGAGGMYAAYNGSSSSSGTSVPTPTQMTLGQYTTAASGFGMNGSIKYVYLFNSDIGNSLLQSLTT
jgi:hypothetical protein